MDAARGSFAVGRQELTQEEAARLREAQQARLVARAREISPAGAVTEAERSEAIGFYNSAIGDVDQLREPRYTQDLERCFPWPPQEAEFYSKLLVTTSDNDTAREVKREYKELLNEVKKDRTLAEKMVRKLGPGTHQLSNGDSVQISKDREGNVRVRIEKKDGSVKEISYNEKVAGDARVESTSADGRKTVTERKGQSVSRTQDNVETSYSLDGEGRPVREKRGPAHDDYTKTTVNPDGSTDTRELIYYPDEPGEDEEGVYEDTHQPPRKTDKYGDAGAGKAIDELKAQNPQKITAEMMQKLIVDATQDVDGQAAGKEYDDLKKFVMQSWGKLTPAAKQVWQIYERCVYDARAKGQTGIDVRDYEKMKKDMAKVREDGGQETKYKDAGAGKAIEDLKAQNPQKITPEMLQKLIVAATQDLDNQAAGKEYEDLKKFVTENESKLTPEAKQVWQVYEKYVQAAKAKGQTGIEQSEYDKMVQEMRKTGRKDRYQDEGAGKAIDQLKRENHQQISGQRLAILIWTAIADTDNQAAGKEYQDLKKFVMENWDKLTPEAKTKWQVYERFVYDAQSKGQTGLSPQEYGKLIRQLID